MSLKSLHLHTLKFSILEIVPSHLCKLPMRVLKVPQRSYFVASHALSLSCSSSHFIHHLYVSCFIIINILDIAETLLCAGNYYKGWIHVKSFNGHSHTIR